ncbi:hypothetical protein [Pseudaminobacter soli (ex Li et al. 2025)]|uniref:Uncharacterized protein n=1 Tax=Pseudaminobacter soli (ex Li et al. 2025) TaxID=1295366 RepID=A0A2P7RMF5_9HYPH|nr:hypothetical protein [Mesorhizobium soli]PSJ51389.1 hypothetical protein C7I85_29615 [Mesorhizobium soli]
MRKAIMLAASITFISLLAANAQETRAPQRPKQATPEAPQIRRIDVVDVSELPQAAQKHVEQIAAQAGEANLQQLRTSIDATPEAKAALDAKGATSAQVVGTSMVTDGTLTLITKKNT